MAKILNEQVPRNTGEIFNLEDTFRILIMMDVMAYDSLSWGWIDVNSSLLGVLNKLSKPTEEVNVRKVRNSPTSCAKPCFWALLTIPALSPTIRL